MLISDNYREQNAEIHAQSAIWGLLPDQTISVIKHYLETEQPESILDYGCGKGRLGKMMHRVQSYDPGVPEFAAPPEPADLVVCTSVLEHIEPDCLDDVLDDLRRLTQKMAFLVISTCTSSYLLSDGRNAHLIQQPLEWWLPKLMERWTIKNIQNGPSTFTFVGRI